MNKKNNDINIKTIWKWLRSEKGKRYSFIIFYLFFFIFLFVFMNTNLSDDTNKNDIIDDNTNITSLPFLTTNLENNNYNFTYNITCPNKTIYNGKKNDKIYTFTKDNNTYIYELINGNLSSKEEKITYIDFSNIYFFKQIIKNSKYISETKLNESNEYIYSYEIKNSELINYLKEEINILETSEIKVKTNSNKEIKEFEINIKGDNNCIIIEQLEK